MTPKSLAEMIKELVINFADQDIYERKDAFEKLVMASLILAEALEFYANRDNYDREGVCEHDWPNDWWVDYGFTGREAIEKAREILK